MFECRACKSSDFQSLWRLRDAPYGDLFKKSQLQASSEKVHPLILGECGTCELLQLRDKTDLEIQYNDYLYQTKVTAGLDHFYSKLASNLQIELPSANRRVVDIGSNDGSFLTPFLNQGNEVLGVEPANGPATSAEQRNIKTLRKYFSSDLAKTIVSEFGYAGLVSANYTLANVPDISDFLIGVKKLLADNGLFSIVTGYHPDQFAVNMWDYIGHDHLTYFSINSLDKCLKKAGLEIVDATRSELKGGSLHVLARHVQTSIKPTSSVKYIKQRESWTWPENLSGITGLKSRVEIQKEEIIKRLSSSSSKYLGIGASISTSYLVNQFEISEWIEYLVDDDPVKTSRYSPRYGIPVISFNDSKLQTFENAIILAWQHTDILINRLVESGFRGKVLIPLPRLTKLSLT
jgi:hypothetical protein